MFSSDTEASEAEADDDNNDDFVQFSDQSQPMALVARQSVLVSQQYPVMPSDATAMHNLHAARNGRTGYPV